MATLPTVLELYDEYKARLESDPDHASKDWSAGSWLDGFGYVAATAGQSIMRWSGRKFLATFLSSAKGDEVDTWVEDRLGAGVLPRLAGESDDDYKARARDYIANLTRATKTAILGWAKTLDSVSAVEGKIVGTTATVVATLEAGAVEADVIDQFNAEKESWKAWGVNLNIELN